MDSDPYCVPATSPPTSPLPYARFYGLCATCHDVDQTLLPNHDSDEDAPFDWHEDILLARIDDAFSACLEEWAVSPGETSYLDAELDYADGSEPLCCGLDRLSVLDIKLDLPVLPEDHELYMQRLLTKSRRITPLDKFDTTHEEAQDQFDRSLVLGNLWPIEPAVKELLSERLEVSQGTVACLGDVFSQCQSCSDFNRDQAPLKRSTWPREETPLISISKRQPAASSIAGPSSNDAFPSPAIGDGLWTAELENGVQALLDEGLEAVPGESSCEDILGIVDGDIIVDDTAVQHGPSKFMHDLRLTSPLMPSATALPPDSIDLELRSMKELVISPKLSDGDNLDEAAMGILLNKLIAPHLRDVHCQLSTEQLIDIDTTLRVSLPKVPELDVSTPWWTCTPPSGERPPLGHALKAVLADEPKWRGITRIEKALEWTPFPPSLAVVDLGEQLQDSSLPSFEQYARQELLIESLPRNKYKHNSLLDEATTELFDAPSSSAEHASSKQGSFDTSRSAQQSVLDEPLPGQIDISNVVKHQSISQAFPFMPCRPNFRSLLQKRKLEIDALADEQAAVKRLHQHSPSHASNSARNADQADYSLLDPRLAGYMSAAGLASQSIQQRCVSETARARVASTMAATGHLSDNMIRKQAALPLPNLDGFQATDLQIVVSSRLVAERSLMARLQHLLPCLSLIEREIIAGDNLSARTPLDACIALSPTEAVLLTTLQNLRQKPLPGQVSLTNVRTMIERIAWSFEKLVVLVSEGSTFSGSAPTKVYQAFDDRDCEAFSALMAWTSSLPTIVQVVHVPGGETELATWICHLIGQANGSTRTSYRLADEETMWERFLCHAGLNAFAAQTFLASIKACAAGRSLEGHITSSPPAVGTSDSDLARVVAMSPTARKAWLQRVVPDSAVCSKLSDVLDAPWSRKLHVDQG